MMVSESLRRPGAVLAFLDGRTPLGVWFERATVALILVNVLCFLLSTESDINEQLHCAHTTDLDPHCPLDIVEVVTVAIFTMEFLIRLVAMGAVEDEQGKRVYDGVLGRYKWIRGDVFAKIDLLAIVPFYVDRLTSTDLPALPFVRVFRLFLLMAREDRYGQAFADLKDIFRSNQILLATSGFVGLTVWLVTSSLYYLAERNNPKMAWCVPEDCECWSAANGNLTSLASSSLEPECKFLGHRFQSIPSSAYFTLLNLFGEFPLFDKHSLAGKFVAGFTAMVSVAVFAIPTGILGGGFAEKLAERQERKAQMTAEADGHLSNVEETPADPPTSYRKFLDASTSFGKMYMHFTFFVITSDVVAYIVGGASGVSSNVLQVLGGVEVASASFFTVDLLQRIFASLQDHSTPAYVSSWSCLIDVLSVAPFFAGLAAGLGVQGNLWVQALRLIRMLKAERYIHAFGIFNKVIADNGQVLSVTGIAAAVMWIFASTVLYYTEASNEDPKTQKRYASVPKAMWMTLLNLSGESPICDYSVKGRLVTGLVGVFAVGFFAIPVGVLGSGFEESIASDDNLHDAGKNDNMKCNDNIDDLKSIDEDEVPVSTPAGSTRAARLLETAANSDRDADLHAPLLVESGTSNSTNARKALHQFLEGRTTAGAYFVAVVFVLILLTVVQGVLETVPAIYNRVSAEARYLEWVVVIFFTLEFLMRLYCAPEDPAYMHIRGDLIRRLRHLISFFALVDLLAILPFYVSLSGVQVVDKYDGILRMTRMLRLLKLEKYVPSLTLIDDVFRVQAVPLAKAGYVAATLWMFCTALMYLFERRDQQETDSSGSLRFRDVPNSLQYTLILLSGDYPLIDFTMPAKIVCFFMIIAAVGVVGVPFGLVASGFQEVLIEKRQKQSERRKAAATTLQRAFRGYLVRKQLRQVVVDARTQHQNRMVPQASRRSWTTRAEVWLFENCFSLKTSSGKTFRVVIMMLIVVNVAAVLLESMPSVNARLGGATAHHSAPAFQFFEAFSVAVFTLEYILHFLTATQSSKCNFSRLNFLRSFWGVVDLVSVAPFYVELYLSANGIPFDATPFRVVRVMRILQLEQFLEAFTLLDDAWRECRSTVMATAVLAFTIWVGGATLFWVFEKDTNKNFTNIPSALYVVAIFLGGEWAVADFTVPGKVLCCAYIVIGIGLFAIPIGTVFESFQDVLACKQEEMVQQGGEASEDEPDEENAMTGKQQAAPSSSCSSSTVLHLSQQLSRANAGADRLRDELALHQRMTIEQLARKDADIAELRRQVVEAEKPQQDNSSGSKQASKVNGSRDEVAHLRSVLDKALAKASAFKKRMEATERELRAKTHAYDEQSVQLLYTMRQLENVQLIQD